MSHPTPRLNPLLVVSCLALTAPAAFGQAFYELAVSASSLQSDARDSPITRQATTVSGVLAVGYAF